MFFGSPVVSKYVGSNYEVLWDKDGYQINIIHKSRTVKVLVFDKYWKAVDQYAALKTVKDIKALLGVR